LNGINNTIISYENLTIYRFAQRRGQRAKDGRVDKGIVSKGRV